MSTTAPEGRDFRLLRQSGLAQGTSKSIGMGFVRARNRIARGLIRIGVTPNHVTLAGLFFNCGAAACFVMGAGHHAPGESAVAGALQSYWPLWAAAWLFMAGACDMIDGAIARLGNLGTPFGGILDSVVDRLSDMVLHLGILLHFALVGNVTYAALTLLSLCNGLMISYTKARAEEQIENCGVGFWQRGERSAAIFLASLTSHIPIMLWQQAISPFFTFLLRVRYAHAVLRASAAGRPVPPPIPPAQGWNRLRIWRFPRGTIAYDITVGLNIAFFVVLPWIHPAFYGVADPLGDWLATVVGTGRIPLF